MRSESSRSNFTTVDEITDSLTVTELEELVLVLFGVVIKSKAPRAGLKDRHLKNELEVWVWFTSNLQNYG
jgi:hypothetical protein